MLLFEPGVSAFHCHFLPQHWIFGFPPTMMARYFLKIVKLFNLIYAKLFVILPLAIVHTMGNLFTNTSLGKVAVSFTHTIKAMEPFFLVLLSALFLREGVPRPSVTSCNKPRCVYLYYSSWFIRAVESRKGDGQTTACEVLLFHHENMGIPWEIAKLGVKQGMWGCIKKIEPGLRAYQIARSEGQPLSKYASMARINTKVHTDYLRSLEGSNDEASKEIVEADTTKKPMGNNLSKFLLVGGAVAVACTIDHGLLTKAVTFGIARRFGKLGGIL